MLNKISAQITPKITNIANNVGNKVSNSKSAQKVLKYTDPKGFNNTFAVLVGLMTTMVVVPRVMTAAKRNPDDKEATKDEITEILFRDVQTCAIILFALKILNSLIASKVGKMSGLPMTNKPFQKVFNSNTKGIQGIKDKACEFIQHPIEKFKTTGKNFLSLIHPTGGVKALNDSEFTTKYSGFKSFDEIHKMLTGIDQQGGNSNKVLKNKVINNIIKGQEDLLAKEKAAVLSGIGDDNHAKQLQSNIDKLKEMAKLADNNKATSCFKKNGAGIIDDENGTIKKLFANYFEDSKNMLVVNGSHMSSALRTLALGIESIYLGFGLPALNQKRLEKKYLTNNHTTKELSEIQKDGTNLIGAKLDTNEARLFKQFLK